MVRAEPVLVRRASVALADLGLRPDPSTPTASVFGTLRDELDERAAVAIDIPAGNGLAAPPAMARDPLTQSPTCPAALVRGRLDY